MDWLHLAQDRDQWRALVNTIPVYERIRSKLVVVTFIKSDSVAH
jgi:hypothetical protein